MELMVGFKVSQFSIKSFKKKFINRGPDKHIAMLSNGEVDKLFNSEIFNSSSEKAEKIIRDMNDYIEFMNSKLNQSLKDLKESQKNLIKRRDHLKETNEAYSAEHGEDLPLYDKTIEVYERGLSHSENLIAKIAETKKVADGIFRFSKANIELLKISCKHLMIKELCNEFKRFLLVVNSINDNANVSSETNLVDVELTADFEMKDMVRVKLKKQLI